MARPLDLSGPGHVRAERLGSRRGKLTVSRKDLEQEAVSAWVGQVSPRATPRLRAGSLLSCAVNSKMGRGDPRQMCDVRGLDGLKHIQKARGDV
jgi:hypothetical protein